MNSSCPICKKGKLTKESTKVADIISGEIFILLECDFCGVKQTSPIPQDLSPYYATEIGTFMKSSPSKIHILFKNILLRREAGRIFKRAELFFDVGCGTGDFAEILYKMGKNVIAVDAASDRPALISNQIGYLGINYDDYEIKNIQNMKGAIVILRHVLEHIREPERFIKKMINYGAKGFYIVVPNSTSLKSRILGCYNYFLDPPRHIWNFNQKSMEEFFKRLNLKVVGFGYDTIPAFIPSLYRYLRLNKFPRIIYRWFEPKGAIAALALPLDWILPGDVLWFLVMKKEEGNVES